MKWAYHLAAHYPKYFPHLQLNEAHLAVYKTIDGALHSLLEHAHYVEDQATADALTKAFDTARQGPTQVRMGTTEDEASAMQGTLGFTMCSVNDHQQSVQNMASSLQLIFTHCIRTWFRWCDQSR